MTRPIYDPAVRVRKDIIRIVVCEVRETLQGNPRPVAEIWNDIETLIEDYGNERVQDTLSEIRCESE
jgi:hypothetical protein